MVRPPVEVAPATINATVVMHAGHIELLLPLRPLVAVTAAVALRLATYLPNPLMKSLLTSDSRSAEPKIDIETRDRGVSAKVPEASVFFAKRDASGWRPYMHAPLEIPRS
jgi:hypothetical protein